jgi:hypothetical protein
MVSPIRVSGDQSWTFSPGTSAVQHGQTGWLGRRTMRASCCMGVLCRGFDRKMQIFGQWSGILAGCSARHCNFLNSHKWLITDYIVCAYWTAGITRRPPDIRSTSCTTIFQVLDRTCKSVIQMYFRPAWRLLGGFCMNLPITSWVTRATPGCTSIFP